MYKLGIDLGGTNIAIGIVNDKNEMVFKLSKPTCLPDSAENIVGRIFYASKECLSKAGVSIEEISAIGVGCPGAIDSKEGVVLFSNNFDYRNVPLASMLSEKFGMKVLCENDANAAAFGEYLSQGGNSGDTLVAITIGTGIGGGVIIGGKLYSGNCFSGGELGHMVINFNGLPCNCGRRGCWEVYASATALIRQTKEAMQNDLQSKMWQICEGNLSNVTGVTPFEGLRQNDETAKKVIEQYADYIAIGIVDIINSFGPATICISGGISNEQDYILEPIKRHIELNKPINCKTNVEIAKLNNDAGIVGAANLDIMH